MYADFQTNSASVNKSPKNNNEQSFQPTDDAMEKS